MNRGSRSLGEGSPPNGTRTLHGRFRNRVSHIALSHINAARAITYRRHWGVRAGAAFPSKGSSPGGDRDGLAPVRVAVFALQLCGMRATRCWR